MKIKEIILEISAGEKARQRKLAAQQQRAAQLQAEKAAMERAKQLMAKRLSKRISQFDVPQQTAAPEPAKKTGQPAEHPFLGLDPELYWDPRLGIEGTEDIGVYLKFHRASKLDIVHAYYSKKIETSYVGVSQMTAPIGWPALITPLGKRFSGKKLQSLINTLVNVTGTPTQEGYVHIIVSRSDLTYKDGDRFFSEMVSWLRTYYPNQGDEDMSATVNWEIVEDLPK